MPVVRVEIKNRQGLHARPAGYLVKEAARFKSDVFVSKNGLEVNAKSIMGVMMLAAEVGSEITIRAEGPDAEEALAALVALVDSRFHEE
ncbi:MAG TPA: HPr family phosphocarrier protein [Candidatus Udaeobacter sp.]|nr:HPr family phosphocarrier protein [Candidatus Udaeobacter sp.]